MNHILKLPTWLADLTSLNFISASLDQVIRLSGFAVPAGRDKTLKAITIKVKS